MFYNKYVDVFLAPIDLVDHPYVSESSPEGVFLSFDLLNVVVLGWYRVLS